jgi:uncharacterized protein YciI
MFIVLLSYKKEISEVEKFIEPHILLLNRYYAEKKIVFSGRKNPRTGGIIVFRNVNETEVMEFIKQDPFIKRKLRTTTLLK